MARAIWTGALAFGLVNVPVGLFLRPRTRPCTSTSSRRARRTGSATSGSTSGPASEVDYAKIVKGYEVEKGSFVLITDEELEAAEPGRSRTIDITDFVDLDEIDPIYFQKTYYLAPVGDGADRAYLLLRAAMAATNKAGIATFVMRGKQYLVAVRAEEDVLVLETMFFADEIRDPSSLTGSLPAGHPIGGRELAVAKQLIESMGTPWRPDNYRDTYRERVEDLIERKRQGEQIVAEAAPAQDTNVVDLMEALRRSVEGARDRRSGSSRGDAHAGARDKGAPGAQLPPETGSGPSGPPDLSQLTKRELAELAGRLNVAGRSKMARDDLEAAVRTAQERQQTAS